MLNSNAQIKYLQFVLWKVAFMAGTESAVSRLVYTLSFVKPLTVSYHTTCTIFAHHLNHGADVFQCFS